MENKSEKYFLTGCAFIILLICCIGGFLVFLDRNGGFGLHPLLIVLLVVAVLCAFLCKACLSFWVYKDALTRGENGLLWGLIVFFVSSILVLIVYLITRKDRRIPCVSCKQPLSYKAKFCEYCGEKQPDNSTILPRNKGTVKYLVISIISMVMMFVCMVAFVFTVLLSQGVIDEKKWNTGYVMMSMETTWKNEWNWKFSSASDGYHKSSNLKKSSEGQDLVVKITGEKTGKKSKLILYISQGDKERSVDISDPNTSFVYGLDEFEKGKIKVRLVVHGMEDVASKISIK